VIRWPIIALFLAVMLAVFGGAHYYVYARFLRAIGELRGGALWTLRAAAVVLALSFPAARFLVRARLDPLTTALDWFGAIWLGLFFYLLLFTLLLHGATAIGRLIGAWPRISPLPAAQMGRAAAAAIACAAIALAGYGTYKARFGIATTSIEARLKNLPPALDGFTVVQISDVHLGAIVGDRHLRAIVDRVNRLNPDLVVITGDLVNEDASHFGSLAPVLLRLRAPHGVLAVAGNHDAMAGLEGVMRAAAEGGVRFLRNEKTLVADVLLVYGIDDPAVARSSGPVPSFDRVIGPEAREQPAILLYHRPQRLAEAADLGIDLMLSGHTHRGQIWPLSFVSRIFFPYQSGSYRNGGTTLYVSRGIGTWGPPMRIGSGPEMVKITLRGCSPGRVTAGKDRG
jgi:uncharacterized protein